MITANSRNIRRNRPLPQFGFDIDWTLDSSPLNSDLPGACRRRHDDRDRAKQQPERHHRDALANRYADSCDDGRPSDAGEVVNEAAAAIDIPATSAESRHRRERERRDHHRAAAAATRHVRAAACRMTMNAFDIPTRLPIPRAPVSTPRVTLGLNTAIAGRSAP
jgi:hypothetical protein